MKKASGWSSLVAFVDVLVGNERIRTSYPFVPNEVNYQAALHSGVLGTHWFQAFRSSNWAASCRKQAVYSLLGKYSKATMARRASLAAAWRATLSAPVL